MKKNNTTTAPEGKQDKGNGHTPGEINWKQARGNNIYEHTIFNEHQNIAHLDGENSAEVKANAARIVECWNNYDKLKSDNQKKEDTIKELLELVKWISKVTNSPEIGIRCDKAIAKHNQ